jgi:hypothetical protein
VAAAARIQIETWAESIGNGLHLSELRYSVVIEKVELTGCKAADSWARAGGTAAGTGIGLRKTTGCR